MSAKVLYPGLIQLVAGICLVVAGVLLPDDTLKGLGYGALGAGLTTFGVGWSVVDPKRN